LCAYDAECEHSERKIPKKTDKRFVTGIYQQEYVSQGGLQDTHFQDVE
jgi:hypothetical protein